MKVLFKNTTKYDKENRNNFINFHQNKYGKKELMKTLLIIATFLYMIIFNIIYLNWRFILLLIPISIIVYLLYKHIDKKKKEKNKKQKNREFTFYFYKRHLKIKSGRQFERMTYFEIKKIFETDENFFLYTGEKHSLILDKDGFEIGTSEEFAEFIKEKCPFRYRNKENK